MKKLAALLFIFALAGCFSSGRISMQNISSVYKKSGEPMHPEFIVYHFSEDTSRLYFRMRQDELLAMKEDSSKPSTRIKVSYKLLKSYDESELSAIIDSASFFYRDSISTDNMINHNLKFPGGKSVSAILVITITDVYSKRNARFFVSSEKSGGKGRQNFLLRGKGQSQPHFSNYFSANDTFTLINRDTGIAQFHVRYYKRNFPLALPPFAMENLKAFDYAADSFFVIRNNENDLLNFSREGFYHFQTDTNTKDGFTLFLFHPGFPMLTSAERLIGPLRYVTTKKEYEELENSPNKKQATDKFWLGMGGNFERSKELIRKFYNRVQDANEFFTSYIEGWKTDRGMVFIVFGTPNVVYRTSNSESWIYGEIGNFTSLNFTFAKVNNPFTDNDYSLNRTPVYESPWYKAIDTWRQGRVYND